MINARLLFALSMAALLPACIIGPDGNGSGSTTETAMVVGTIYETDGKTPAVNARVSIRPRNTLADTSLLTGLSKRLVDTATVVTDDSGKFEFDSTLDTGLYVIEADDGDGNMALIDSVKVVDTDSAVKVEDTLRPAGAISGVVYLSEGGDPRKVFILALGLDRFTRPDSTGKFTFGNLAEAVYDLTLISSLDDYGVLEVPGVEVVSDSTRDLDTLKLKYTGIPVPKGLSLAYDTLKQIVTLTWNQADTELVSGYNVYRQHQDSGLVKLNAAPITDTTYSDSTAQQDQNYTYQVKAVDKNGNEGLLSLGAQVKVVSAVTLVDSAAYQGYIMGLATDRDGKIYLTDRSANIVVVLDTGLNLIDTLATGFNLPHDIVIDSNQNKYVIDKDSIYKFDDTNSLLFIVPRPLGNAGYELARLGIFHNSELWVKIQHWPLTSMYRLSLDSGALIDSIAGSYWPPNGDFAFGGNDDIVVCNQDKLIKLSSNGTSMLNQLQLPQGNLPQKPSFEQMELGHGGLVYLVDRANSEFLSLDSNWQVLFKWDAGTTNFQISEVYGFHLTPSGDLIVAEINKIRRYRF